MNVTLLPSIPNGSIQAISSKSAAHRILICSAFADGDTIIRCDTTNKDINATADCLRAMGADITYNAPFFTVKPIKSIVSGTILNCNESGSTLRFLLPVACALGIDAKFSMSGRLPERPLSPLYEELIEHGARLSSKGSNPLLCQGKLRGGDYRIRGDISSQFISGLLFALTLSGIGGNLVIEGATESAPYIDMTIAALSLFDAQPKKTAYGYEISKNVKLRTPEYIDVEGDWSNAAFPLCMGAISKGVVSVTGLKNDSCQGDRAIIEILDRFGADITFKNDTCTVKGGNPLHGIDIDASQIPDTVPALAVVAATADGTTRIYGAARLRFKESDRISSVCDMLTSLGADIRETEDGLLINGKTYLTGGTVDSFNDHRIAMSASVASVACSSSVTVLGAECAEKSYPDFWKDIKNKLGIIENT